MKRKVFTEPVRSIGGGELSGESGTMRLDSRGGCCRMLWNCGSFRLRVEVVNLLLVAIFDDPPPEF